MQVGEWTELDVPAEEKLSFFRVTRHTFGRTALLLSGGGGLGTFHMVRRLPPSKGGLLSYS